MEELNRLPDNQDVTLPNQQPVFTGAPITAATKIAVSCPLLPHLWPLRRFLRAARTPS